MTEPFAVLHLVSPSGRGYATVVLETEDDAVEYVMAWVEHPEEMRAGLERAAREATREAESAIVRRIRT